MTDRAGAQPTMIDKVEDTSKGLTTMKRWSAYYQAHPPSATLLSIQRLPRLPCRHVGSHITWGGGCNTSQPWLGSLGKS